MLTRSQYLAGEVGHSDYYGNIISAAGFRAPQHLVEMSRKSTDRFFNDVPLAHWDAAAAGVRSAAIAQAFKDRGDYLTLSGQVCLLKEAVRRKLGRDPINR